MSDEIKTAPIQINHGWRVTFAGMGINLALGILYTWSVISKGIPESWGWNESDKSWPYSIACLVFCLIMVPAGRMQDKLSPKLVATIGGILVGVGFIIASFTTSLFGFILAFGVLAGAGIGFGYASATPPAVKWFPPAKTGMIAGIVVSGFGLASVYAAPLAKWLMNNYEFSTMLLTLGIAFLVVVVGLAQILKTPPAGYVPAGYTPPAAAAAGDKKEDFLPKEMLKTIQFYMLWFMYACGAGAGLMIISKLAAIAAQEKIGISLGFLLVAVLAIGNGGGRIVAGILSDKIGRKLTMFMCFVSQAIFIFMLSKANKDNMLGTVPAMALISALIGANYGANLSLFPSITKDYYGAKNFGMNYGLVFTSWGIGGFMLAKLAGMMFVKYQTFDVAYYGASGLLIAAAAMVFFVKPPHHIIEGEAS
ncbi:MAG: OFA family MFS transporter [Phycisphaerae bacterium]|nr:OFA family MFS transporter [Phycisphaerae bacterium]